jgi:hypothetical protein
LTIKTIINHCADDFNICLIDDETFSKLIPSWDIRLSQVAEPMKSYYREIGLLQLVYYYGGMVVPNSFLCLKNLKPLYEEGVQKGMFVLEKANHTLGSENHTFLPDLFFFGAQKNNHGVQECIEYLKNSCFVN